MLGLDPFYVANEGRFVVILPEDAAEQALAILRRCDPSASAARIGGVKAFEGRALAVARTGFGTRRVLARLSGEQLPRIC